MAINTHGGGAKTAKHGLKFEQDTRLEDALIAAGYTVVDSKYVKRPSGKTVGILAPKNKLYTEVLEKAGIDWRTRIARKTLPDEVFINTETKDAYIIEKKFQNASGSTDEKLYGCNFKKTLFKRLLLGTGYNVEYVYVCNDWFKHPRYKDMRDYINDSECHLFFNEIPLDILGLGTPIT